jgi:transcriptional regulator with XRE-family HTH domain
LCEIAGIMPDASQPPATRTAFARRLRELRIPRGYKTARKFAITLGIDENRYTRYERAEVEPDLTMLMRICETLRITPNELFGMTGEAAPGSVHGFGESAKNEDMTGAGSEAAAVVQPRAEGRTGKRSPPAGRRQALAWKLARELARAEAQIDPSRRAESAIQIAQRTSRLYTEIESDPFGLVARAVETPPLTTMERNAQAKIVALMDELIDAVNSQAFD